jgi:hypothetical protein
MIIKTHYKPDLTSTDIIEGKKNLLSFNTKTKKINDINYLQITEMGWEFIWLLIESKLRRNKIFLLITHHLDHSDYSESVDFFKMKRNFFKKK